MEPKELRAKLNGILHAIAAGRSCEQILASDRTLSYHHIFRAVTEAPTTSWDKDPSTNTSKGSLQQSGSLRTRAKQRAD
jgi:hypothetical protein